MAACARAGVALGVGTNKRFWPSMVELRRVVASGALGRIMLIEGHYSNENSGMHFSAWRDSPDESPGGGMTGTGIHLLDAFVSIAGPVAEVNARLTTHRPGADPRDTIGVNFEFASGLTGYFGAVRASPIYWRVHVFGDEGSAEALGETQLVLRSARRQGRSARLPEGGFDPGRVERLRRRRRGRAPYPISPKEIVDVVAAFEGIISSMAARKAIPVGEMIAPLTRSRVCLWRT